MAVEIWSGKAAIAYHKWKIILLICLLISILNIPAFAMHDDFDCAACHEALSVDKHSGRISANDIDVNLFCLSCHDRSRDISGLDTPYVMNNEGKAAGGDFAYTLTNHNAGHNVFPADYVLGNVPPGGRGMSSFTCLSCHASHTNGNYRSLKKNINGIPTIVAGMPDKNYLNNVYISGMSNFCSACHNQFHGKQNTKIGASWARHPVNITLSRAKHVGFKQWMELEDTITKVENPDGNVLNKYSAKVFCLSCHYSHASAFDNAMRWSNYTSSKGCYECHNIASLE